MRALARTLARRGHAVLFFAEADVRAKVEGVDVGFVPLGAATHPPGSLAAALRRIGAVRGLRGIRGVIADAARRSDMLARELPDALRGARIDLVVADQLEGAGTLAAQAVGLPYVSVANGLLIDREDAVPPQVTGFAYAGSQAARRRNRGAYRVIDFAMRPQTKVLAGHALRLGLPTRRTLADHLSPFAEISQLTEGFDFPREAAPAVLHHVGPLRDPPDEERPLGIDLDERPFVFCSLGTLLGGRLDIFLAVAAACRQLDAQLLVAHCGGLTEAQQRQLPPEVHVADVAPQRAAIARADAVVSHAGMNTVLDALFFGVPTLAVPLAFDHPAIAARLERSGAGIVLPPRLLTPARIADGLGRLLGESVHRSRAQSVRREMLRAGGAERAADIIERVLATRAPVPRAASVEAA